MKSEEEKVKKYDKRLASLISEFDYWKSHLQDISNYLMPRRGRFLYDESTGNDGKKRHNNVIDGTATRALRVLAAGMQGGLTSPARPWFRLTLANKDLAGYGPVKLWLDTVRNDMLHVFQKSNFYNSTHALYGELGGFGTGSMYIGEDEESIIRCYPYTVGEYYLDVDHTGRVRGIYRIFKMTAQAMVSQFGVDKVSESVKQAHKQDTRNQWTDVVHIIEYDQDSSQAKKTRSIYFEYKGSPRRILREKGYYSFPAMAPRWSVTGSEIYGRSPGMEALADAKMLMKMQQKSLKALDKVVDPPMNAPSSLKTKHKTIISGGVTYVDATQGSQTFSPTYQINPDIAAIEAKIGNVQESINQTFYTDLFLMIAASHKTMTAHEVAERQEEKLLMIGPVIERVQSEFLNPVIDRVFDIMERNGHLPPPPEELQGVDLEIEYISLLAQAQKMVGVTSIEQTISFVASLAQYDQTAWDRIDIDETIEEYAHIVGSPSRIIRDIEKAKEMRDKREAAQQEQQQAAETAGMIEGAKTASEINMGENNALDTIMEGIVN